ncbi:MAG: WD40 repeat domain-containing protein, partial [Synechococcales cyanobacterium]
FFKSGAMEPLDKEELSLLTSPLPSSSFSNSPSPVLQPPPLENQESKPKVPPPNAPKTWDCRFNLTGHSGWVSTVAIAPDNSFIASGSFDKTIRL